MVITVFINNIYSFIISSFDVVSQIFVTVATN